jgi:hypothetical protein
MLEVIDLLLELRQVLLGSAEQSQNGRLSGGRDLIPEFSRDRRLSLHATGVGIGMGSGNPGPGTDTAEQVAADVTPNVNPRLRDDGR